MDPSAGEFTLVEGSIGVDYSTIEAGASGSVGNEMLGLNGTADGDIATAYANAQAGIGYADNELDIFLSGEACAAFYEGDIEGCFTFLGFEIEVTLGGFAGGAGIGGTVGVIDNKAKVEVLGGVGVGGKVGISIGLAD